ncbi:hypothetical protein CAOG_01118 [Capsaspora owczarzaki ATCC 30864]|uniref:SMP-LTD domain-containing protein n=1 Tax=Capsaspora owczarzaki (strain ATCC 30864) TaxID=595528 RepID=A0A0D2X0U8_CAPO3|nr:hypothetical protein CAOG_01118 [Capsaspora owczarzaki ATCC 30864]KJE89684.1 hypothetical protein CAOG_001118 [Capsaspora owczarzaki ATCC 30864]|eukprot:XP_004365989.1 hypothetical protein CAOG_01118 [Capsaspora owczarzaki ATCC 30864]
MSITFDWAKIKPAHADLLKDLLNAKLREAASSKVLPDLLGPIVVTEVALGSTPPRVDIEALSDPLALFSDPALAVQFATVVGGKRKAEPAKSSSDVASSDSSSATGDTQLQPPRLAPPAGKRPSPFANLGAKADASSPPSQPTLPAPPPSITVADPDAVQLQFALAYTGDVTITVETDIRVNTPVPGFISLPITLGVTGLNVSGRVIAAHNMREKTVCVTVLPLNSSTSPLADLRLKTTLGDPDKKLLKHIEQLESFIVRQLRQVIHEKVVYPRFIKVLLDKSAGKNSDASDSTKGPTAQ